MGREGTRTGSSACLSQTKGYSDAINLTERVRQQLEASRLARR
ncbi:MAG: hypothetical protein R3272_08080 [Candidatus Promineifilaceae bacterium]|nr:hypothetical protein [Candidatus Promineifilaceae bacterium]